MQMLQEEICELMIIVSFKEGSKQNPRTDVKFKY